MAPQLYIGDQGKVRIVGHDGSGNDAINSAARYHLDKQDGIIIFETGNYSIASRLADEWFFWKAGISDRIVMQRNMPFLLKLLVIGYVGIIALSIVLVRQNRKVLQSR